jgi:hypothetical protein
MYNTTTVTPPLPENTAQQLVFLGRGKGQTHAEEVKSLGLKVGDIIRGKEGGKSMARSWWNEIRLTVLWIGKNEVVYREQSRGSATADWHDEGETSAFSLTCREWYLEKNKNCHENNSSPITLDELKAKIQAAEALIGKLIRVTNKDSEFLNKKGRIFKVVVQLDVSDVSDQTDPITNRYIEDNGYAISLSCGDFTIVDIKDNYEIVPEINIRNHDGVVYVAIEHDEFWKMGCAEIDKSIIHAAHSFLESQEKYNGGNSKVTHVTIGKADFTKDILNKLICAATR